MSNNSSNSTTETLSNEQKEAEALAIAGNSDAEVKIEVHEINGDTSTNNSNGGENSTPNHRSRPEEGYVDVVGDDVEITVADVSYTTEKRAGSGEEYPVLHIFGRTEDQTLEHVKIPDFEPYFYVPIEQKQKAEDHAKVVNTETGFESIRGDEVLRAYTQIPGDVRGARDDFDDHYEADILFPNRFLLDKDIFSGIRVPQRRKDNGEIVVPHEEVQPVDVSTQLRMNIFDIEVEDRNGFPEDGDEEIICISSYDNYDDEYVIWIAEPSTDTDIPESVPNYTPIERDEINYRIEVFDSESRMLGAFLDYLDDTDPDLVTGWNFEDFDATYLIDRLDKINDSVEEDLWKGRLSRVNEAYTSNWGPTIKGRVVLDLLYAYKRTQFSEKESYRLDAIGEDELGVGKEHYSGDIGDLWENDPETLLEYNLRDVEICVELNEQQDIIPFWNEVRTFVGCLLEDAPTPSDACDMYVLHKVQGNPSSDVPRFVLPSKGQAEYEDYEGGAVFDPISGVRENVTVLDLKSLYPMCMVTVNASPETKVENPEEYDGETFETPNGIHFKQDEDGIIREIIDELLAEREEKKAARNEQKSGSQEYEKFDRQQASVKVIMNSLYGVLGWERFRLYDKDMGAGVTATGRGVIEFTEEVCNEKGLEVTYGDTDSVMLELLDVSPDDVPDDIPIPEELKETHPEKTKDEHKMMLASINKSKELEEHINNRYDEYAKQQLNADEHRFQIEFEKLYRRFFQAGKKKRYAGDIVWKEEKYVNKIDITGFESERSDIAQITKTTQIEVIEKICTGASEDEIKDYVHKIIQDVQQGNIDVDKLGIPGGIGKKLDNYDTDTAQVRGAKYANMLLGTNFQNGSKPKRLYLKKVHPDYWEYARDTLGLDPQENPLYGEFKRNPDVICYNYPEDIPDEFQIDWDKMLNKTLRSPISRVLTPMGISWEDAKSGQTQTGLSNFM